MWGAPRIHGELLKLGIEISQATVGRWMPWRPKVPSPTWRTFLRNHLPDIAAIDMFVVATATFRLLYALIVLSLDRRRVVHFEAQIPRKTGSRARSPRPFPGTLHRAICCGTETNRMVRPSAIAFEQWESRRSSLPRDHPGRTPTPSVSSVRSAVNAWITLSSSASVTCAASCRAIFNIIIRRERIFRSTRTVHGLVLYSDPPQAITLLPSRRSAACIIAMSVEPRKIGEAARSRLSRHQSRQIEF